MCTDETMVFDGVESVNVSASTPTIAELLKNTGISGLLDAKKEVEELLELRIQQEYTAMKANAAAIALATNQPFEKVLEMLSPTEKKSRKLSVVESIPRKPERVKYRHPEIPELTWSGRGKEPAWLKRAREEYADQALLAA